MWQQNHSLGAKGFLYPLFHTCCTMAVHSVDLGFNWIGGLGSLRLSLVFIVSFMTSSGIVTIWKSLKTPETIPNNFFSIIPSSDDRGTKTSSPLDNNKQSARKFCSIWIQSSWFAAKSSHILFQWSDTVNIVYSWTSQEIGSVLQSALPGTEQYFTVLTFYELLTTQIYIHPRP